MKKYIFFDVGANIATNSLHVTEDPNAVVYGFEPTPYLIDIIKDKIKNIENYNLIEKAVSNFNGKAKFNISGNIQKTDKYDPEKNGWWGCSSLLEMSDNIVESWNRDDISIIENVEVEVIRLDFFIEQNNISHIDYMHCDAQGSDLNVLRGLGKYIEILHAGMVEAANKPNILYKNQNSKEETIEFLETNGFKITNVYYDDIGENEVNIRFTR